MDVIYSISSVSVFSLIMFKMVSISSVICFRLFSQYSNNILVSVNPKLRMASSHLRCNAELTTGTCGVKLTLRDLGVDRKRSHLFR